MLSSTIKKARIVAYMCFLLIFEATNVCTILECNTCESQSCNFYLLRDWRLSSHRPAVIDIHNLKIENNLFLTAGRFKGLTKASINSLNYPLRLISVFSIDTIQAISIVSNAYTAVVTKPARYEISQRSLLRSFLKDREWLRKAGKDGNDIIDFQSDLANRLRCGLFLYM